MSEDPKIDRSPRSATYPLEEAIVQAKKIYDNAGKSAIRRDLAFKAMGYAGSSGASLSALATLHQYGLADKAGKDIAISNLALRIFHPTTDDDRAAAIREAALTPPLFKTIFETHHALNEELLANHLIHQGFNPDRAKRVASIYKANSIFANLGKNVNLGNKGVEKTKEEELKTPLPPPINPNVKYLPIPLMSADAQIPFPMSQSDYDMLLATLDLWKPRIVAQAPGTAQQPPKPEAKG